MDARVREQIEEEIRRSFDAGSLDAAAEAALRGYGRELYAFLAALHRDAADASEVFSLFLEGMWRSLPGFGWQSSFRTWAYGVARRTSLRYQRDTRRRVARLTPWPEGTDLSRIEAQVRTET